ncbi:thioredoxin [Clostridium sp. AF19-22AC]|jgi:thioredoxin 1|uniref:Thioredoxin n=1 Tax=Faecalicatena orotica TaxID=1544 RepID=A0A2Y9BIY1_9FIRM|nr:MULTISPECIES: thioredoxin domain-containing protein [Clostridia]PWJ23659.1 thioredoxin 1 [Faecalicatena orotica]RHR22429.1 thioredoxin [Clostridium sp. AF19-22AC]SSA57571.1 thioredoxin 1 [Faecalicatena orotica]
MKIKVTAKNYPQEVLRSGMPVLVEFFAVWCGKCAMMADIVDELASEYAGRVKVCQIDIEECEILASEFDVEVVPTFVLFKGGRPVSAASGVLNKEVLIDMIES